MPEDISIGKNTAGSFVFGTMFGTAKEVWRYGPSEAKGVVSRINLAELAHSVGKTSLQFAVVGGLYSIGAVAARTARDKDDSLNFGVGGALAGFFLGMRQGTRGGSLHQVVLKGATLGMAGVICNFCAGKFTDNPRTADNELVQRFSYVSAAAGKDK
jgi:hypothetical protein